MAGNPPTKWMERSRSGTEQKGQRVCEAPKWLHPDIELEPLALSLQDVLPIVVESTGQLDWLRDVAERAEPARTPRWFLDVALDVRAGCWRFDWLVSGQREPVARGELSGVTGRWSLGYRLRWRYRKGEFTDEVFQRWRQAEGEVAQALDALGDELAEARASYDEVKKLDETLFEHDYESV